MSERRIVVVRAAPDAERSQRLTATLEAGGIPVAGPLVLSNQSIWSAQDRRTMATASVLLVLWSGEFAARLSADLALPLAKVGRGKRLVVAQLDHTPAPSFAGKTPVCSIIGWRSRPDHAAILALAKLVRQKRDRSTWARRLALGAPLAGLAAFLSFVNWASILADGTELACKAPFSVVSDLCGSANLGGRPKKAERLRWERIDKRDCDALLAHATAYPDGAYAGEAARRLAFRSEGPKVKEIDEVLMTRTYVGRGDFFAQRSQALADAQRRANLDAEEVACRPALASYRLVASEANPFRSECHATSTGHTCGVYYDATCRYRRTIKLDTCG